MTKLDCSTDTVLIRNAGRRAGTPSYIDWELVIASQVIPDKMEEPQSRHLFHLFGAHQPVLLMDWSGWLSAFIHSSTANAKVDNAATAYRLVPCKLLMGSGTVCLSRGWWGMGMRMGVCVCLIVYCWTVKIVTIYVYVMVWQWQLWEAAFYSTQTL